MTSKNEKLELNSGLIFELPANFELLSCAAVRCSAPSLVRSPCRNGLGSDFDQTELTDLSQLESRVFVDKLSS
jgi:hypothetical protein